MRNFTFCLAWILLSFNVIVAQKKNISLEDIWQKGTFQQEYLEALSSLNNGEEYAVIHYDSKDKSVNLEAFNYETGEKTRSIIRSKDIPGLDYFQTYQFNADESLVLLGKEVQPVYRRSRKAIYFVYDLETKTLQQVSSEKIMEPAFSPDGSKVAFAFENNLFIKDLKTNQTTQITDDGKQNQIINGTTDWVYEEEFAFTRAFDWNSKGTKIAFLKFDESEVPEMSMDIYGSNPQQQLYPEPYKFKYPKAGDPNSVVSLHIYDVETHSSKKINLKKDYEYLPRLKWTNDSEVLSVQAMNRHQNELDLLFISTKDNSVRAVLEERDENYIDITDDLTFLKDNSFLWTSEKSNWNHIYHYSSKGKLLNQITKGNWDVTRFYGIHPKENLIYFQSTENGSINRDVYSINLKGKKKKRLTQKTGTNRANFSKNFKYFINTFSDINTPNLYSLHRASDGKELRVIEDNQALQQRLKDFNLSDKEISTLKINGYDLNMYMIKPPNFDPKKKYPLLLYQYSGPGSQLVSNSFFNSNDFWHLMLAQQGYIVACIDGRGTGFKGADFKKLTQLELGKYEVEDQIEVAKKLSKENFIDEDRIGIWGWSYGGFMSANSILQAPDVFKMAIAVAPVTSWRFYDTVYTERFMTTPQENPKGYDLNSPITYVDNLKGKLLLIHGSADDNVHVQNTMQMVEALIQADKEFDWLIYPDYNHGIYGGNVRLHLFREMTNYVLKNL